MKPLHFGLFLIVPIASFLLGHQLAQNSAQPTEASEVSQQCEIPAKDCDELEKLKSKLNGITSEEIRDYLNTHDAQEKLQKADEILGKIMQVLVANVGYRLPKEDLEKFGRITNPVDTQPIAAVQPIAIRTFDKKETVQPSGGRLKVEIGNVQTEEEAKKVLERLNKEFSSRLQQSGNLSVDQVRELTGNFEGAVVFAKDPSPIRATLNFQGRLIEENKLRGTARVQLYGRNGRVTSDASSRGNLGRDFTATESSIFVEIGSRYMELVYFPALDQWMGSMLEMQKGNLTKIGDVVLRRR